ncbi:VOC family protein [Micromonospora sp. NPDC007271]|uniref:VOC family protein n=1 Tax=Micromonospora sp. NPDC007271 TaxID=3154587 RepID=UPI0033F7BDCC
MPRLGVSGRRGARHIDNGVEPLPSVVVPLRCVPLGVAVPVGCLSSTPHVPQADRSGGHRRGHGSHGLAWEPCPEPPERADPDEPGPTQLPLEHGRACTTDQQKVPELVAAGATVLREEWSGDTLGHVVMQDPEGNEFCVA